MIFMRMEDGQWINVAFIERIFVARQNQIVCVVDSEYLVSKTFDSQTSAQDWLDNYMQWSVNGG